VAGDACGHRSAVAEGRVEAAVGVAAHQSEGDLIQLLSRVPPRYDPSDAVDGDGIGTLIAATTADVGDYDEAGVTSERIVERAVGIVASKCKRAVGGTHHDDPPNAIDGYAIGVIAATCVVDYNSSVAKGGIKGTVGVISNQGHGGAPH